jgi:hypothetical protein
MLLINHFNLGDDEALRIWEMAGYDRRSPYFDDGYTEEENNNRSARFENEAPAHPQPMQVMLVTLDSRIFYVNGAEIVTDDMGVVLNFTQSDGAPSPFTVSRIGMSYGQAEQLLQTLQRALLHKKYLSGPKQLPPQAG